MWIKNTFLLYYKLLTGLKIIYLMITSLVLNYKIIRVYLNPNEIKLRMITSQQIEY